MGRNTWVRGNECPRLYAALHVIEIPYFVQLVCIRTLNDGIDTSRRLESCNYLSRRVGRGRGGDNASVGQPSVGRQSFEQGDNLVEKIDDLFLRGIICIAIGI